VKYVWQVLFPPLAVNKNHGYGFTNVNAIIRKPIQKMKTKLTNAFTLMLLLAMCFTTVSTNAQTKRKSASMKDCCMMKDGKMMVMKDGKLMTMVSDMTMKNGTVCMVNGECMMKDGRTMMMKEGECMDMSGNLNNCTTVTTRTKKTTKKTTKTVTH